MLFQWIITGIIVFGAMAYALWRLLKPSGKSGKQVPGCDRFSGSCAQCIQSRGGQPPHDNC